MTPPPVPTKKRYTVAVDFDGVLHRYDSPWVAAHVISDPPVEGAIAWLERLAQDFDVVIFSTRCKTWRGRRAVRRWLQRHLVEALWARVGQGEMVSDRWTGLDVEEDLERAARTTANAWRFTATKPPALVYIDDRAWRFAGQFPTKEEILRARPWNK